MNESDTKVFHKRKKLNLKIKQDLQIWLLIRIMGTILLTVALASVIIYFYSVTVVDTDYLSFAPKVRKVSEVLLPILLASLLTSFIAGLLLALFLPQKIAGPIYRIEQDLQQIRTGDLSKTINLRSADILKDLADSVNLTVQDLGSLIHEAQKANSELETRIAAEDLAAIRETFAKQKSCLDQITTKADS